MKVIIQGKQLRVTEGMKAYAAEHLVAPLRKFYDNEAAELRVELGRPNARGEARECHLTLHMPGARTIQIEESTPDVYASLDAAADRLVRTAKKQLSRMRKPAAHRRAHPLAEAVVSGSVPAGLVEDLPNAPLDAARKPRARRK